MRPEPITTAYFFATEGSLSHASGCLMQGFARLGIAMKSNVDIDAIGSRGISAPFSIIDKPLHLDIGPPTFEEDLFIIDVSEKIMNWFELCKEISPFKHVVLINMSDTANFCDFDERALSFCAHMNRFAQKKGNILPIGFGLSQDIIELSSTHDLTYKNHNFLHNFTNSLNQDVRLSLELAFVNNLSNYFYLDRRRLFEREYSEQLATTGAVLAYGGMYHSNLLNNQFLEQYWRETNPDMLAQQTFQAFDREAIVFRWDSWRFWESAVFACAPLHLDFEKYGFMLPVMPQPWVHYIPIDLSEISYLPDKIYRSLLSDPDFLANIGKRARKWALEHYSPTALADYILSSVYAFKNKQLHDSLRN